MNEQTNHKPLVSVLIVTFNQRDYLKKALDSILMQKCNFSFEIQIGEDCSTDGTRELCIEYARRFPEIVFLHLNEKNKGFLNNYFDLFQNARGKYIADCGGDDFWLEENRLQIQVNFLEQNPEYSMVAGNWFLLDEETGNSEPATELSESGWDEPSCFGKKSVASYINQQEIPRILLTSACMRTDWALEAYRQNPELFRGDKATCEDVPLILSAMMKGPVRIFPDYWAVYRKRKNSVSHSQNKADWIRDFAFKTFEQTLFIAKTYGLKAYDIRDYLHRQSEEFALCAFLLADETMFRKLIFITNDIGHKSSFKFNTYRLMMRFPKVTGSMRKWYAKKKLINTKNNATS
jgi:glycosyltransferase involved in cell wall biosynthesis